MDTVSMFIISIIPRKSDLTTTKTIRLDFIVMECHSFYKLFQILPSTEKILRLPDSSICFDYYIGPRKVGLYACTGASNQRWVIDSYLGTVVELDSGNGCWDIDGKIYYINEFNPCHAVCILSIDLHFYYLDGLIQRRRNYIANAVESCIVCIKPTICRYWDGVFSSNHYFLKTKISTPCTFSITTSGGLAT